MSDPRTASVTRKLGEAWDRVSLTASVGTSPAHTLTLGFQLPEPRQ